MVEPIYLYGISKTPSKDDGALFHFTKFDKLLAILESMTLRSAPLARMNDLNEARVNDLDWGGDADKMLEVEHYIQNKCSIICFAKNYQVNSNCEEGSNHPAMWAHYADDSNGACIVLDKEALLEINKSKLHSVFYKFGPVSYETISAPDVNVVDAHEDLSISAFVQKNYHELFFKKHTDWSYETEERFFVESPQIELNIRGAIKYIVLGGRLKRDRQKMRELIIRMITPQTSIYHYLMPQSFAQMSESINGYLTEPAASDIIDYIKSVSQEPTLAKEYLDWVGRCKEQ